MSANAFDERMKLFESKGVSFGSNPNLFRVVSEGVYNRSVYTLVAYVVLPTQDNATNIPNLNSNPNPNAAANPFGGNPFPGNDPPDQYRSTTFSDRSKQSAS
jgi:hypothetical protein